MTDTQNHIDQEAPAPQTLWVTDAELIRRMGVPEKIARAALAELDKHRDRGFPQKQALWGDRRYWPAVRAWLDATNGLKMSATPLRRVS
mgnify:CR=1 FL=1